MEQKTVIEDDMITVKFEGKRKTVGEHTAKFSVEIVWKIGLDNVTGQVKWRPSIHPLIEQGIQGEPDQDVIDEIAEIFRAVSRALPMGPEHFRILYEAEKRKKPKTRKNTE